MDGWIKISRKILDSQIYPANRPFTKYEAWIDLLLIVNFKDTEMLIGNEPYVCKRGQSIRSIETYQKRWCWTRQQVRSFFNLLEKISMIELKTTSKTTILTICNYDKYQSEQPTNNQQITNEQPTNNQQITINKEREKRKKEKNEKNIDITSSELSASDGDSIKIDVKPIISEIAVELNNWAKPYFDEEYINDNSLGTFDKLIRIDKYTPDQIKNAIHWARNDDFWTTNFLSPVKLRNKDKTGVKYIDVFLAKILKAGLQNNFNNSKGGCTKEQLAQIIATEFGGTEKYNFANDPKFFCGRD